MVFTRHVHQILILQTAPGQPTGHHGPASDVRVESYDGYAVLRQTLSSLGSELGEPERRQLGTRCVQ